MAAPIDHAWSILKNAKAARFRESLPFPFRIPKEGDEDYYVPSERGGVTPRVERMPIPHDSVEHPNYNVNLDQGKDHQSPFAEFPHNLREHYIDDGTDIRDIQ
tara:strand:+ start:1541 stop:1849 length:309 start_codon:yes stop_codon:yes gene_type:complete